jgi:hypothetical protein
LAKQLADVKENFGETSDRTRICLSSRIDACLSAISLKEYPVIPLPVRFIVDHRGDSYVRCGIQSGHRVLDEVYRAGVVSIGRVSPEKTE